MSIKKFKHIRLEEADNGWVLEFTKVTEGKSPMDSEDYMNHQLVFSDKEEGGLDSALEKMKEMHMFNKVAKGGLLDSKPPSLDGSTIKAGSF